MMRCHREIIANDKPQVILIYNSFGLDITENTGLIFSGIFGIEVPKVCIIPVTLGSIT